ncbi:MAG: AraC family transcriptional regulator [Bacteroides sp.]|nr:AraC family transcriptional regulator [Bacteroides sp.]
MKKGTDPTAAFRTNEELVKALSECMEQEKPYLDTALQPDRLAGYLNIPEHQLLTLLKESFGQTFQEYVDSYRVEAFKYIVKYESYARYTPGALAEHCGFVSTSCLLEAFRRIAGISPGDFIRSLGGAMQEWGRLSGA